MEHLLYMGPALMPGCATYLRVPEPVGVPSVVDAAGLEETGEGYVPRYDTACPRETWVIASCG